MLFGVRASWVGTYSKPRPQKDLQRTAALGGNHGDGRAQSPQHLKHTEDRAVRKKEGHTRSLV